MIISSQILLRMRTVSDKNCREMRTCFMFKDLFYENCAAYEIMCKNVVS